MAKKKTTKKPAAAGGLQPGDMSFTGELDIPLDIIVDDPETQPRAAGIDEATVADYGEHLEASKGPFPFPPISVLYDGERCWCWDGWHRIEAYRRAGRTLIRARVEGGTREKAILMAAGANAQHGLRRSNADKVRAVETVLRLKPDWSNVKIADHCHVGEHMVREHRAALLTGAAIPATATRTGKDGVAQNISTKVQSRFALGEPEPSGASAKADSCPKNDPIDPNDIPMDEPPPTRDQVGQAVTGQVAEAFARRDEITHLMSRVSDLKNEVLRATLAGDPLFTGLVAAQFQADSNNLFRALKAVRPFAACPYCRAAGCKTCHGRGWIGEFDWEAVPGSLKTAAVAGKAPPVEEAPEPEPPDSGDTDEAQDFDDGTAACHLCGEQPDTLYECQKCGKPFCDDCGNRRTVICKACSK